ncbi:dynamin family protein [Celeribacter litoreus]|uniref:dynamin family protein n=1 Tax=Celeribacter litoreus TaxID=2876714 RepID=UPI001CCB104E|nr:dynamin family protein [Celeribacter litoreus]MCA0043878.1 dynamin family protein [Celeribacter litoreus]
MTDISQLSDAFSSLKAAETLTRIEQYRPKIAIFGRSGVGKTSLVNAMSGRPGLLPVGEGSSTAIPVNVCLNIRSGADDVPAKVQYFSGKDWDRLARSADQIGRRSQREDLRFETAQIMKDVKDNWVAESVSEVRPERVYQSRKDKAFYDEIVLGGAAQHENRHPVEADIYLSAPWVPWRLALVDTPGLSNDPIGERLSVTMMRSAQTSVLITTAQDLLTSVDIACLKILRSPSRMVFLFVNCSENVDTAALEETLRSQLEEAGLDKTLPIYFGSIGCESAAQTEDTELSAVLNDAVQGDLSNGVADLVKALVDDVVERQGEKFVENLMKDCTAILTALEDGRESRESGAKVDFDELDKFFNHLFLRLRADFTVEMEERRDEFTKMVADYSERYATALVDAHMTDEVSRKEPIKFIKSFDPFYMRVSALTGWFNAAAFRSLKNVAGKFERELDVFLEAADSANACTFDLKVPPVAALERAPTNGTEIMLTVPSSCVRPWLSKKKKAERLQKFLETEANKHVRKMTIGLRGGALSFGMEEAERALEAYLEQAKRHVLDQIGADWSGYDETGEFSEVRAAG